MQVTSDGQETQLEEIQMGGEGSPGLREIVRLQIQKRRPRLILDMSSVRRIDSTGIGNVVAAWQHVKNSGGELVLASLQSGVRDVFAIVNLDSVILIFDSVAEAIEHFADVDFEPPVYPD